jgi:phage protein D
MAAGQETTGILPDFEVAVDGAKIPPEAHVVVQDVEVEQDVESIGMFSLLLGAGELENDRYQWIDGDLFRPGSEIRIGIGYGPSLQNLMVGEITGIAPEFPDSGMPLLRVRGYERLYRLGFGRKTRSFRNMKDSDIAAQIAQEWTLTPQTDDSGATHEYVLQRNQTDREFLIDRARLNRYEVSMEDKTLYFRKANEGAGKTVTLTYPVELMDFYPCLSTLQQVSKVQVRGWSAKDKKEITGEAGGGDETSTMGGTETAAKTVKQVAGSEVTRSLCGAAVMSASDAEALANARFNQSAMDYITGEGTSIGNPDIKAGTVIELKNLGARFSGLYYVASCAHRIGALGYTTAFRVRRSAL